MYKHATVFVSALLVVWCLLQHFQINELQSRITNLDGELIELTAQVAGEKATTDVLQKLVVANSKKILSNEHKRTLTVTAYSPRKCETDSSPFTTAANNRVRAGIIAVSRDLFDQGWVFGKKVYIKNYGIFTIDDLMASSKRNQIDIFMHETDKALRFGKKKLDVYLLEA